MATKDPFRNFRFRLEISGVQRAGFSEVGGLFAGDDPIGVPPGSRVTLGRGITYSLHLQGWRKSALAGELQRRDVRILVFGEGGAIQERFEVAGSWPSKLDGLGISPTGNGVAIAALELTHNGVRRLW